MPRAVDDDVVISRYLDADGALITMPRKHSTRAIVLAHIAAAVPAGIEHDETQVNNCLRPFSSDVAMLRRYLVDEGLLLRRPPGIYQRP